MLFSGDNILGYGTAVIHPPDGNMTDYMKTLERLLGFDISLILPGHGPLIGKPEAKIREYIKHRIEREQQVLAALRKWPEHHRRYHADDLCGRVRRARNAWRNFPCLRTWRSSCATAE